MLISTTCPICKKSQTIEVSKNGYRRWKEGELIQSALQELNADQREMLISGVCPECWNELFKECNED